jgi:ABC-type multidrug transport system permease subunit
MVGSSSRTITATMAPVAITVLNFFTYTGFVIPAPYMRPWLGWFRYINPVGFTFESLLINEVRTLASSWSEKQ